MQEIRGKTFLGKKSEKSNNFLKPKENVSLLTPKKVPKLFVQGLINMRRYVQ